MASNPPPKKAKKSHKPVAPSSAAGIGAPEKKKPAPPRTKPAPAKAIKIDSDADNADKGLNPNFRRRHKSPTVLVGLFVALLF